LSLIWTELETRIRVGSVLSVQNTM